MADRHEPPGWTPGKFRVEHHERGEIPEDEAFVLVPGRDPAAVAAIRAYARATPDPSIAARLNAWADDLDPGRAETPAPHARRLAVWVGTLAREVREGGMDIETALQRIAGHALRWAQRSTP